MRQKRVRGLGVKDFNAFCQTFQSLQLFGSYISNFIEYLQIKQYSSRTIIDYLRLLRRLDQWLLLHGYYSLSEVTSLLIEKALCASDMPVHDNVLKSAAHTMMDYLCLNGFWVKEKNNEPFHVFLTKYEDYLVHKKNLKISATKANCGIAKDFFQFIGIEGDKFIRDNITYKAMEEYLKYKSQTLKRSSLHSVGQHLRTLILYLEKICFVKKGLSNQIDLPRMYKSENLPHYLPWITVEAFLSSINKQSPMGRRDYAMFMLVTHYGLRASEVSDLKLKDVKWREGKLSVRQPKTGNRCVFPLTKDIVDSLVDYIKYERRDCNVNEIFLRAVAPIGKITPVAISRAFQERAEKSGLDIPYKGCHCLRHSFAVHMLKSGVSILTIRDFLGHKNISSTEEYLRLSVEDLREVGLDLPTDTTDWSVNYA